MGDLTHSWLDPFELSIMSMKTNFRTVTSDVFTVQPYVHVAGN